MVKDVAAQLVVTRDYSLPLCMRLRYEPSDPYVVRATFLPTVTIRVNGSSGVIFWLVA
ncbi:hypothetical protein [Streptomyces sp. NBC_00623]|uniref:hypothetical protein n=1 Tax=Streptomyces sp. NBC_00623 TaxID=2975790 RepID=UPI0030E4D444